jgi:hypothetical protein
VQNYHGSFLLNHCGNSGVAGTRFHAPRLLCAGPNVPKGSPPVVRSWSRERPESARCGRCQSEPKWLSRLDSGPSPQPPPTARLRRFRTNPETARIGPPRRTVSRGDTDIGTQAPAIGGSGNRRPHDQQMPVMPPTNLANRTLLLYSLGQGKRFSSLQSWPGKTLPPVEYSLTASKKVTGTTAAFRS